MTTRTHKPAVVLHGPAKDREGRATALPDGRYLVTFYCPVQTSSGLWASATYSAEDLCWPHGLPPDHPGCCGNGHERSPGNGYQRGRRWVCRICRNINRQRWADRHPALARHRNAAAQRRRRTA